MQLFAAGDRRAWESRATTSNCEVPTFDQACTSTFDGRIDFVRFMALIPETFGPVSVDKATIATRGDEFVLTEMHWTRVGDTAPMGKNLVITRMSEGLLLISITFDAATSERQSPSSIGCTSRRWIRSKGCRSR